jgi:hypothetical protein
LLTSIVVVGIAFSLPQLAAAQSPCAQWDVSQGWYAMQGDYRVQFQLRQRLTNLEGSASYYQRGKDGGWVLFIPITTFGGTVEGAVTGTLRGDSIEIDTGWGGVYIGKIDNTGRIDGYTYDKKDSTSKANWYSDRRMNCLQRVGAGAPPATAQPKPRLDRVSNDFNGDGHADILWHNATTGESQVWLMNGSSRVGRATIVEGARPFLVKAPWRVAGSNDVNGDRKPDIVWHNSSTGETQVWFMNGHRISSRVTVVGENGRAAFVKAPFRIVGTGDFNQDGKADILWHNSSTNETQMWLMNDHRVSGRATVLAENGQAIFVGAPWRIVSSNDMNGDRKPDIVWHNSSTGETQVWLMNVHRISGRVTVVGENGSAALVGAPWRIVGTNDFNRDGHADILWHNSSSGETQIWFMNGTRIGRRATVDAARDGGGNLVKAPWSIVSH